MSKSKHNKIAAQDKSISTNNTNGTTESSTVARVIEAKMVSGPMPSADELAEYERILPGSADRLLRIHERQISLVEEQARHRMALEKTVVCGDGQRASAGICVAAVIGIGGIIGSVYLGMNGHEWLAGTIFATAIVSLVGTFIYGTNSRREERNARHNELMQKLSDSS